MSWASEIEGLNRIEPSARDTLERDSRRVTVPAGTVVFGPGAQADNLIVVLRGAVRVQHVSENGRQIVLYRVNPGETCIMTTACLMAHEAYSAEGVTETEVDAVMVPRRTFDTMIGLSSDFRTFVFDAYAQRMTDLFLLIEDVAFQRMDIRLAQKLLDLSKGAGSVGTTHQQLAAELGTAREVVSRLLQEFRRRGLITSARGEIVLNDPNGLKKLAAVN